MTIYLAFELGIAGMHARLANTTARNGCKAAGPRPGSGLATCWNFAVLFGGFQP